VGNIVAYNTLGTHRYHFTDNDITSLGVPVVYYRLKQKDADGRFTYSKIIALTMDNSKNFVLLYPNPLVNRMNLYITSTMAQKVQARIIDNTGRTVKQQQWNIISGSTSLYMDVSKLAKGLYHLELKGDTVNERKTFIIQ